MAENVSLMVLPTGSADALPQILLEQGGVWRDMSPPLANRALVSVTAIRESINALLNEVMNQLRGGAVPAWAALRATFRQHYNMVIPSGVGQALQRSLDSAQPGESPVLRIHTHAATEWIPWEILHDGTDFLALRFQIARLPITATGPDLADSALHPVERVASLLAEHVFDPPVAAQLTQTWEDTFDGLLSPAAQEVRFPPNGAAEFPNVDHFMNAAVESDILHVTCHGGLKDKQGQLYWTLNHQSPLTFTYHINATILGDLNLSNSPLVFGNACDSQAAGDSGLTPGFGSVFFAQGALAFIGTFAPITQTMAVEFAQQFYRRLLQDDGTGPVTIGQALWQTKTHFDAQNTADPSYLYYTLYGPAETIFQPA